MEFKPMNCTQIPNHFFDETLPTLKLGEMRVLLILMRQWFGWEKCGDHLSISKLEGKTGLSRKAVCLSLQSLLEKRLIEKRQYKKNGLINSWYSMCVDEQHEDESKEEGSLESLLSNIKH